MKYHSYTQQTNQSAFKMDQRGHNGKLPIKKARLKFQRNAIFSVDKVIGSALQLYPKTVFHIGQVQTKKYWLKVLFLLFKI